MGKAETLKECRLSLVRDVVPMLLQRNVACHIALSLLITFIAIVMSPTFSHFLLLHTNNNKMK